MKEDEREPDSADPVENDPVILEFVYSADHLHHEPTEYFNGNQACMRPHPESPARALALREAALAHGLREYTPRIRVTLEELVAVHDPTFLELIRIAGEAAGDLDQFPAGRLYPDSFAVRPPLIPLSPAIMPVDSPAEMHATMLAERDPDLYPEMYAESSGRVSGNQTPDNQTPDNQISEEHAGGSPDNRDRDSDDHAVDAVSSILRSSNGTGPAGIRPTTREIAAALGFYCSDTETPLSLGTGRAIRSAAACALTAAGIVLDGYRGVYALCRPPGHHAGHDSFGGYCYLNNAALAAERLSRAGRAAVLDIDYHHGNGTQEIFYGTDTVFFASIHAAGPSAYPHYWGSTAEIGTGRGRGFTRNFPVPPTITEEEYCRVTADALQVVRRSRPEFLVVSLGFDTHRDDPVAGLCLTESGYRRIGGMIAEAGLPCVIVQEGGYGVEALGLSLRAFLAGINGRDML